MRAESNLLELCRVQPIGGKANYELRLPTLKPQNHITSLLGITYYVSSYIKELKNLNTPSS